MKDTAFSLEVKKALINFGGIKILGWNLFDVRIGESSFDFGIISNREIIYFLVIKQENNLVISHCLEKETKDTDVDCFLNLLNQRAKIVNASEISKYVDSRINNSIGHRAPNCMAVPNCGA